MELGERITICRKQQNMTIEELARRSGVARGTLTKIISGATRSPALDHIQAIARALEMTLNDLVPADVTSILPEDAMGVAREYARLDQPGKNVVKVVLAEEGKRVKAEAQRRRERERYLDEAGSFLEPSDVRIIPLYLTPAAAGYTEPVFGEDFDYLEVGEEVPRQADFAVKIDGDSMEPYILDGSTVYVNRDPLSDGDVGIFFLDGDMLCKQYHKDGDGTVHLLSLNRARADADRTVREDSTLSCYGRVILPHQPHLAAEIKKDG